MSKFIELKTYHGPVTINVDHIISYRGHVPTIATRDESKATIIVVQETEPIEHFAYHAYEDVKAMIEAVQTQE